MSLGYLLSYNCHLSVTMCLWRHFFDGMVAFSYLPTVFPSFIIELVVEFTPIGYVLLHFAEH